MTSKTPRIRRSDGEAERRQELLRADAAAVIDDDLEDGILDEGARLVEERSDESAPASQRQRSQVYSIRVPVERLEQVRLLAKERGVAPTVMLREWVLAQLDAETRTQTPPAESGVPDPTRPQATHDSLRDQRTDAATQRLEAATAALMDVAAQLATTLAMSVEVIAAQRATTARPAAGSRALPLVVGSPAGALFYTAMASAMPDSAWSTASVSGWPRRTEHSVQVTRQYVWRGLAALRSTVESASSWPGFGDHDLDMLYMAADEELANP